MKLHLLLGLAGVAVLAAPGLAERIHAIDAAGNLIRFESGAPGEIESSVQVTGFELDTFREIVAIDFRPATGQLFALLHQTFPTIPPPGAEHCDLYLLEPETGAGSLIGISYDAIDPQLSGAFDFSPVDGEIRIVNQAGSNVRMSSATAAVSVDTPLSPGIRAVGLAFDRNVADAGASTAYALDSQTGNLVRVGGVDGVPLPHGGTVTTIGPLGLAFSDFASFDISPSGIAYAVLSPPNPTEGAPEPSQLYTVNLETGGATLVGSIGPAPGLRIVAMAVAPEGAGEGVVAIPALGPWGLFLLAAGIAVAVMFRLRRLRSAVN